MKPRSGVERMFIGYAEELPPPRKAVVKWAYKHCFKPVALWWKHRGKNNQEIWCQCCGHREPCDGWLVMSSDGAKCEVKNYKDGAIEMNTGSLVSTIEVFKGVQVVRTFEASRCNYNDGGKTRYGITELYQIWMLENGREIITTIGYDRSFNYMRWHYGAGYSIGRHNGYCEGCYAFEDTYNVNDNFIYPRMLISPFFRRRSIDNDMVRWLIRKKVNIPDAFCSMAKDARLETLFKTGYRKLFIRFARKGSDLDRYWKSINICHRHGYAIDDVILWCDHIDMLVELGMDIHNPKYICPENLRGQHGMLSKRLTKKREKEKLERDIANAAAAEGEYRKMREKFFGLLFRGEHITIVPIRSVKEMAVEGRELHHCVFSMKYYEKKDSLLLSARDNSSQKPVETIELSLKTFEILQSRGNCNHDSPFHDEILSLVNNNIPAIRKLCVNG